MDRTGGEMGESFVVRPKRSDEKEDRSIIMTIRIDRELQEEYDKLAGRSSRSRNELINMALRYALANLEFMPDEE